MAKCVEKKPYKLVTSLPNEEETSQSLGHFSSESLSLKLRKLLDSWKHIIIASGGLSLAEVYEHTVLANEKSSSVKLLNVYGPGEDSLPIGVRLEKEATTVREEVEPSLRHCGSFDFERSYWCGEFLELFFKLAFDQTEDWDHLIQAVNQTPLLPEFYDVIRRRELGKQLEGECVDKANLMQPQLINQYNITQQNWVFFDYLDFGHLMNKLK